MRPTRTQNAAATKYFYWAAERGIDLARIDLQSLMTEEPEKSSSFKANPKAAKAHNHKFNFKNRLQTI